MNEIRLSICMPTYNFGAFIAQSLDSIVVQLALGVEVVVLDGGSTDDTAEVVRRYTDHYPAVRYIHQDHRGGIDRDMARTIELARGEYCWLFSSDDIMKKGAIDEILKEIATDHDIYIGGMTLCDRDMRFLMEAPVSRAERGATFDLQNQMDRRSYFELADATPALFSFMGSLIIKRRRWLTHELEEEYIGSLWAHVVRIFRMIPGGLRVKYLGESLLYKRGGNDSFMDKGLVARYAVTIDGYHAIGRNIFGASSFEAYHIRRLIVNEFPPQVFLFAKGDCSRKRLWKEMSEIDRLVEKTYQDRTLRNAIYRAVYRLVPVSVYEAFRNIYKKGRKAFRLSL